jgi:hypothetical protein
MPIDFAKVDMSEIDGRIGVRPFVARPDRRQVARKQTGGKPKQKYRQLADMGSTA